MPKFIFGTSTKLLLREKVKVKVEVGLFAPSGAPPIGLQNIGFNMFFMASCLIFSLGYFFRFKMDVYKDRQNSQKMTKNKPWIYLIEPYTLPLSS